MATNHTQETNWRRCDPLNAAGHFEPAIHARACLSRASRSFLFGDTAMKIAHNLIGLAFAIACVGLWEVTRVLEMLHRAYPFPQHNGGGGTLAHGDFEMFCVVQSSWLPYFGIPAIAYALISSYRGRPTVESFCAFASVLALAFVVLLFTVLLAGVVSWMPLYD